MAAGLGFKDFQTGEVLTAADVDGYLMQGVWVFASAAARDAAVTSPQEGNFAYLKDTNVTTYYTGSAWANLDTTGMTNPMTTTGDTIYSSSGSTPARLGIGSTGQVLTVAGGVPSWSTISAGGMTLLQSLSLSGSSTTSSTFSSAYNEILIYMKGVVNSGVTTGLMRINGDSGSNYTYRNIAGESSGIYTTGTTSTTSYDFGLVGSTTTQLLKGFAIISIYRPSDTDSVAITSVDLAYDGGSNRNYQTLGTYDGSAAVTELTFLPASGTWSSGTAEIYGVK